MNYMNSMDRVLSIDIFNNLLLTSDLFSLQHTHDLYIHQHKTEPIAILNYGRNFGDNNHVTNACRGLVVETFKPYKVISRGFDRFIRTSITNQSFKRATIKEDGSLIFMFKYNDNWYLSTMHNFADDMLPYCNNKKYSDLFLEIIDQPLNEFAEKLVNSVSNDFNNFNDVKTFCFEMCSFYNRVVRKYETPTLFLLAIFGGDNGNIEYVTPPIDLQAIVSNGNVKHVKEIQLTNDMSYDDIFNKVLDYSKNELCFEGFVVQTNENKRIKMKNPYYLILHTLKYRGWIKATPELMVSLILDKMDDIVISNMVESIGDFIGSSKFIENEVNKRCEYYKKVISDEYSKVCDELEYMDQFRGMPKKDYINILKEHNRELFNMWGSLILSMYNGNNLYTLEQNSKVDNWNKYFLRNMNKIFPKCTPFIDKNHDLLKCKIGVVCDEPNDGLSEIIPSYSNEDGKWVSKWVSKCFCGKDMNVVRLRYDLSRYKTCHCGINYGILTYKSGSMLMVCSDNMCLCTHEVNQLTLKPLGIPSSLYCKSLRLYIHELIRLCKNKTRDECYDEISRILGKSKEDTHMAMMGISECVKVINLFR